MTMQEGFIAAIDTHCHVYPDHLAERSAESIGKFYQLPIAGDGRVSSLIRDGGRAGSRHFVICGVATTPHQVLPVSRFIADTVQSNGGRLTGLGAMHPDSDDQERDFEEILSMGLSGVKIHPDFQRVAMDDERYLRIFALCEGRLPVLCHLGDRRYDCSNAKRAARVLERFPNLKLIGAHMGGWSVWRESEDILPRYPNLTVDCSSSLSYFTPEEGVELIRRYGAERVLYGTDYPVWDPLIERRIFEKLPLTMEEKRKTLYQNAAALYEIPGFSTEETVPSAESKK